MSQFTIKAHNSCTCEHADGDVTNATRGKFVSRLHCSRQDDPSERVALSGTRLVTGFTAVETPAGEIFYSGGTVAPINPVQLRIPQRRPWLEDGKTYNEGCYQASPASAFGKIYPLTD